jgi:linoleoyl-CoA desaturase
MHRVYFEADERGFLTTLNQRVEEYFSSNKILRTSNLQMRLKVFILCFGALFFYGAVFFCYCNYPLILVCAFFYGTFSFLIAFNVVHDAGHGALFKTKTRNDLSLHCLDLFGVSSFLWKYKHELHHHSPNVKDFDALIDDFKMGRLLKAGKWTSAFRFQHLYIPVISLFYSASLVLFKDWAIIRELWSNPSHTKQIPRAEYFVIAAGKGFAFYTTLYLPFVALDLSVLEVTGFFLMVHMGPGLLVGLFAAPAHFNTEVDFPEPDANGLVSGSWAVHQLSTTEDFSTRNRFCNYFLGGFNHHVAHHLYPSICHCHYPKITPIIQGVAAEFGVPYKAQSFIGIYRSHLKHLKNLSKV